MAPTIETIIHNNNNVFDTVPFQCTIHNNNNVFDTVPLSLIQFHSNVLYVDPNAYTYVQ